MAGVSQALRATWLSAAAAELFTMVYARRWAATFDRTNAFGLSTKVDEWVWRAHHDQLGPLTGISTIPSSLLLPYPGAPFPPNGEIVNKTAGKEMIDLMKR